MTQGTIFDIKSYAVHDGPGIRTTTFFKGCPLTCMWCHDPESHALKPEIFYWDDRCIRCGACVEACPEGALAWKDGGLDTDRSRCNGCGACVSVCPAGARELVGVAGYSDYFCNLGVDLQEEVIARTAHGDL